MVKKAQPMCIPFPAIFLKLLSVAPSKDLTSLLKRLIDHGWVQCKIPTGNWQLFQKQGHDVPTKRQFQDHWHWSPCKGTQGMPTSLCQSNNAPSCKTLVRVFLFTYNHCAGQKNQTITGPHTAKKTSTEIFYVANCQWPNMTVCRQGKKCSVRGLSALAMMWIARQVIPLLFRFQFLIKF